MNEKLSKKLFKKFKFLKKKEMKSIDVKDGWYNILSDMCQKLSDSALPKGFIITKIFSKLDEIRVYTKNGVNSTRFIIDATIEQSAETCEECGNNKELQMCEKCKELEQDETYDPMAVLAAQTPPDPNATLPTSPLPVGGNNGIALSSVPADYYFKLENDPSQMPQDWFIICPKAQWDQFKVGYGDEMPPIEPLLNTNGFSCLAEDEFEYNGQAQAGRTLLISLGFVENTQM